MTTQNKNLLICAGIVAIVAALYVVNKNKNEALAAPVNTDRGDNFPLLMGSVGERVLMVQKAVNVKLKSSGAKTIAEDGIWGPETEAAVLKIYQSSSIPESVYKTIK
jgi:peptidoglycan hydrolase-like protein with peptidoglycan-binding domain